MIQFTFLSENKTEHPECAAEHGLSIYIEAAGKKLLFDTGASPLFAQNADALGIDLGLVEHVVISHGHFDHTGGVPEFCRRNHSAPIYIHKDAFGEAYGLENGELEDSPCGILWDSQEKGEIMKRAVLTDGAYRISDDIVISGTLPAAQPAEAEKFYIKKLSADGVPEFTEDTMSHEQCLMIRDRGQDGESKGIYVFSGCSHKGVLPAVEYARSLFPGEKILGLAAGMHLYSAGEENRQKTAAEVASQDIGFVMPVHCTGRKGIAALKGLLGERCIAAGAGDSYAF